MSGGGPQRQGAREPKAAPPREGPPQRKGALAERAQAPSWWWRRRVVPGIVAIVLGGAGAAVIVLLTGGSEPAPKRASAAPRPVTADEANRLAIARFQSYRATGAHFFTRVSTAEGALGLEGDVDFRRALGNAKISGAGSAFILQWTDSTLLAWPAPTAGSAPTGELPARKPVSRPLAPARSAIDAVLAVILGLGRDRPDNAQLIRRNGARWLRSATVGATKVDVLQGPGAAGQPASSGAAVRYWVDASGKLLRLDAFLGGGSAATRIDLDATAFKPFTRSAKLRS